jgi:hypothetical protein
MEIVTLTVSDGGPSPDIALSAQFTVCHYTLSFIVNPINERFDIILSTTNIH